jgi:hypothetical protein
MNVLHSIKSLAYLSLAFWHSVASGAGHVIPPEIVLTYIYVLLAILTMVDSQ